MNKFSPADISYFEKLAEETYAKEFSMVVDRYVLPIVSGVYLYNFPDYVFNVRRVTYRGRKVNPYSGKEQIWSDSTTSEYIGGEPREYIYNYYGRKQIRFFPTPQEDLPTDEDPWSGEGIMNQCIMSFYRIPDLTNEDLRMPEWIRDQFIDTFVAKEISKMDSTNFDSRSIKAFENSYQIDRQDMVTIWNQLFKAINPTIEPFSKQTYNGQKARPVLPWNFGVNAED